MGFFRDIAYSGYSEAFSYQVKRGVMLSNVISVIYCFALILLFLVRNSLYSKIPNGLNLVMLIVGVLLFILPVLLNKLKLTTLSRLITCVVPIGFLWLVFTSRMANSAFLEPSMYDSLRIFLLAFSFAPYLLFEKKERVYMLLAILPTLFSFLFFENIFSLVGLSYLEQGNSYIDYDLMQMRTFIAYIILSAACFTFHSIIGYSDNYNLKIVHQLKNQSEEITAQNEKLIENEEKLNHLNASLESLVKLKTEKLKIKNELLLKYAHANAHHVRGPVARLLGLIQLSKLEAEISYASLFNKIDYEILALDKVIKRISKELNELDD